MIPINIGPWEINQECIRGTFNYGKTYTIDRIEILDKRKEDNVITYDWLLHITSRGYMKIEEIKDFNSAFLKAIEIWELEFDLDIYNHSRQLQEIAFLTRKENGEE